MVGSGARLADNAVRRGYCSMHRKLAGRRGRAREGGLARIELDVVVKGWEMIGRDAIGELVEDFLSNDCVSPLSRSQMRATAPRRERNAESLRRTAKQGTRISQESLSLV